MSLIDLQIVAENDDILVTVVPLPTVDLVAVTTPDVLVLAAGNVGPPGPPGPQGQWVSMTQAEYDAIPIPDPDTLYVII